MTRTVIAIVGLMALSSSVWAQIHGGDIELEVDAGKIQLPGGRVYESELGGDFFAPFDGEIDTWTGSTDEPGFDNEPLTFPTATAVGFNILDELKVWTGSGFATTPYGMELELGSLTVQTASGFVVGLQKAVAGDGSWHEHVDFTLIDSANAVPSLLDGAAIYLLNLEMFNSDAGIANSDPFWIVFNYGEDESVHDAAVEWVEANLIPEPASVALLGAGALLLGLRRRPRLV